MCIRDSNYTLGLKEQSLFPEITYEEVDLVKGMNVSIITTANTCLLYTSRCV